MELMIGFFICVIASIACLIFSGYYSYQLKNNVQENLNLKSYFKRNILLIIGFVVLFIGAEIICFIWKKMNPTPLEIIEAIGGGLIFSASLGIAINSFILHYYVKNLPQNLDKWLFRTTIIGFVASFIFAFVTLNGFADHIAYPLFNSISFTKGLVRPGESGNIAFYALFILSGAILVYFLCDHKLYLEYGEHGLLESTFLVAFPAGIIGARIFYVIGNFNLPSSQGGFDGVFNGRVFAIWEGGLTILGGAIMGIVVGVLWFKWRHKNLNIFLVIDYVVPTILIAQAVGRFGNFFNLEVHGLAVNEDMYRWLPKIIFNNMHYSTASGGVSMAPEGMIYVPLFLIEGAINIFGFALLAHVFGIALRKYTELGDLAFGYVAWYGLTRFILEPLRDPSFNMGKGGYWSWVWSMVFIIVGCLLILANHLIRYFVRKHKNEEIKPVNNKKTLTLIIVLGIISLALLVSGIICLVTGEYTGKIAYSVFNVGFILLVLGISTLVIGIIPTFNLLNRKEMQLAK